MNLKESFHYQNYLEELAETALIYLQDRGNLLKVSQEHMRKAANPEAENETIDGTKERNYPQPNNTIIDFLHAVIEEKYNLAIAIGKAKAACTVDIDAEASTNRLRRKAATVLARVGAIKPGERKVRGSDFKFNANGDQVAYSYEIKETTTIDFDRNKVKTMARRFSRLSDDASSAIDRCMVDVEVAFAPLFLVGDTFEDALESFANFQSYTNHAV